MLQQEPTSIQIDPRRYLTLVHGEAGVGKTSWAQQIPGHYFMITESGTEGVRVFGDIILTWDDFLEKGTELVEAQAKGFEGQREVTTIVIDTYEALWERCGEWVCKHVVFTEKGVKQHFDRIDDIPYGKGYKEVSKILIGKLQKLLLLGFGIVLLSHTKERSVTWGGQTFSSYEPNLSPSAAQAIVDACGAVGHFVIEETIKKGADGLPGQTEIGRWMYWQKQFLRVSKHRLDGFPARLPLPKGCGYETYVTAFQNTLAHKETETGNT